MAELNCNLTVDSIIHKSLCELATNIMDKFGIAIEYVEFDWINIGTAGDRGRAILGRVGTRTSKKVG